MLDSLTEPGDYVLDPFMGGGTTIIEAAVSGRHAIGTDVNELARFVTRVKTTPLSEDDISEIRSWAQDVRFATKENKATQLVQIPIRNMPVAAYSFFDTAIKLAGHLRFPRRRLFARCALLRIGQWALDVRSSTPQIAQLCDELEKKVEAMLKGLSDMVSAARTNGVYKNKVTASRQLFGCSASASLLRRALSRRNVRPKLVLTSPPYPGVHVLYHRWQVLGRRETPAPYWIADVRDGRGASYYTMGGRSTLGVNNYFTELSATFNNLKHIISPDARVVQLVSFSDANRHLPRYLEAMSMAGFEETSAENIDSRQVRLVPNRKWYNQRRLENDAGREVLLIHRPIN